jgi:hypothetical protein
MHEPSQRSHVARLKFARHDALALRPRQRSAHFLSRQLFPISHRTLSRYSAYSSSSVFVAHHALMILTKSSDRSVHRTSTSPRRIGPIDLNRSSVTLCSTS